MILAARRIAYMHNVSVGYIPSGGSRKNIWGAWPQAHIQKCGLRGRRHSNGGAEGVDGGGVWGGGCKILAFSPSKWCILMHSGAYFRPTIAL